MNPNDPYDRIDPRWRHDLQRFIETGEGDADFLAYLNRSPDAQRLVTRAFEQQAKAFEELSEALHDGIPPHQDDVTSGARGGATRAGRHASMLRWAAGLGVLLAFTLGFLSIRLAKVGTDARARLINAEKGRHDLQVAIQQERNDHQLAVARMQVERDEANRVLMATAQGPELIRRQRRIAVLEAEQQLLASQMKQKEAEYLAAQREAAKLPALVESAARLEREHVQCEQKYAELSGQTLKALGIEPGKRRLTSDQASFARLFMSEGGKVLDWRQLKHEPPGIDEKALLGDAQARVSASDGKAAQAWYVVRIPLGQASNDKTRNDP